MWFINIGIYINMHIPKGKNKFDNLYSKKMNKIRLEDSRLGDESLV